MTSAGSRLCCRSLIMLNPTVSGQRGLASSHFRSGASAAASASASSQNPYQILGVKTSADTKEIKEAFFAKSKENHPDLNPDNPEESAIRFQEIVEAYEILCDAEKKERLDAALRKRPTAFKGQHQHEQPMDWRNVLRKDVAMDDAGPRKVDVDMSLEAMKRRWSLYKKHWEGEEQRLKDLEELKTAFRIQLDERRRMFEHLTPEEQVQFKESIRTFRHPKFSKGTTQVIFTDQENRERHLNDNLRMKKKKPAAAASAAAEKAGGEGKSLFSWLFSRFLQTIHSDPDRLIHLNKSDDETGSSSNSSSSCSSDKRQTTVSCDDTPGYTTTSQRKKSFANGYTSSCSMNNNNNSNNNNANRQQRTAENQQKRQYSTLMTSGGGGDVTKDNKAKEDFDPYEYMEKLRSADDGQQQLLPAIAPRPKEGELLMAEERNPMVAGLCRNTDFERETDRVAVAVDKVARRHQKLQLACFKADFDPRITYDDDKPDFVEHKTYFEDELNPLRSVKAEIGTQKAVKDVGAAELVTEALKSFMDQIKPKNFLTDGGEKALRQGQRFRSELSINFKFFVALMAFLTATTATYFLLDGGYVQFSSPSDEFMQQAIEQQSSQMMSQQQQNKVSDAARQNRDRDEH